MFGAPVSSGLTLGKVISGISKTLSVANQVIPLYKQAKPMISNAKTILSVLKDYNNSAKTSPKKVVSKETIKKDTGKVNNVVTKGPNFFL